MTRLPTPGQDDGQWGYILNDFLQQEHLPDGSLKIRGDLAQKADDAIVVHVTGNETIAGLKNFTGTLNRNGQQVVVTNDSRLSDARQPLAHAGSHASNGADSVTPAAIGASATTKGGQEAFTTASSGSAYTISLAGANLISLTITANCTLTFPAAIGGASVAFTLELIQDTIGSRLVTWPGSVKWSGGAAPVLSTAASALDVYSFYTIDGGATWRGFLSGSDVR